MVAKLEATHKESMYIVTIISIILADHKLIKESEIYKQQPKEQLVLILETAHLVHVSIEVAEVFTRVLSIVDNGVQEEGMIKADSVAESKVRIGYLEEYI